MQVRGSERLRLVLSAALQVGNALNEGSHLCDARAVRLESLLKMADLRVSALPSFLPLNVAQITPSHTGETRYSTVCGVH